MLTFIKVDFTILTKIDEKKNSKSGTSHCFFFQKILLLVELHFLVFIEFQQSTFYDSQSSVSYFF